MNCSVAATREILGLAGVTVIDTSVAEVTVRIVEPEMLPEVAVMVVEPTAAGTACPMEPAALLTVATEGAEELQITDVVIF